LVAVSCAKKEDSSSQTAAETTPPPPATLTDANVAAIVLAANDADIDNGNMAKDKTKNSEVRAFAVRMVTDHSAVNKQAKDLAGQLSLTPEDNDVSRGLKANADSTRDELKKLDGAAFDKAYIDNEVAYHKAVIGVLDDTLIPSAQNAELKTLLTNSRPAFQAHLEHAEKLQTSLPQ
jgi:putative membrane protein